MKILVAPSWYPPSGGHFFRHQSLYLHQRGHQIAVVALHWREWFRPLPAVPIAAPFPEHHHFLRRWPQLDVANWRRWIRRYRKILDAAVVRFRPEVIYVHSGVMAGPAVHHVARRHHIPYVILEHRARFFYAEADTLLGAFHESLIAAFQGAHRVAAVSSRLARAVERRAGLSPSGVTVIPNPLPPTIRQPVSPTPPETFTFLTVGRPHPVKGWDIGLRAVQHLLRDVGRTFRWKVVGDEHGLFRQKIRAAGLQDVVTVLPFLSFSDLSEQYRRAHALLHPARHEAFGMTLIEALCHGLPVVATRSGGPEDIIRPGTNGFLADPSPAAVAEMMKAMMEKYAGFDPKGIARQAFETYRPDHIMPCVEKLLGT